MNIGIFPASGALGGSTLNHLLSQVDPQQVTLISRHPQKLSSQGDQGATLRKADFDDAASLDGAFEGIKTLNLISYPTFEFEHRAMVAKRAIDSAIAQGVRHIFYSSLAFAKDGSTTSKAHVMLAHLATEAHLRAQVDTHPGFSYTVIRQGLYHESWPVYLPGLDIAHPPETGEIVLPHSGGPPGLAWAKRDELGEATARLIAEYQKDPSSFPYVNKSINLSGPRAYSLSETAEIIGKAIGRDLRVRQLDMDSYVQARKEQEAKGSTELAYGSGELARLWATVYGAIEDGEAAVVTPHLREWLGREPEAFEVTIRAMVKGSEKE